MGLTSIKTLLTPFQFSSRKMQAESTLGNVLGNNLAIETMHNLISWYEMWVNPEKVDITTNFINNRQNTARGIVTHHFRKDVSIMSVSGTVGYVAVQSKIEELKADLMNSIIGSGEIKNLAKK